VFVMVVVSTFGTIDFWDNWLDQFARLRYQLLHMHRYTSIALCVSNLHTSRNFVATPKISSDVSVVFHSQDIVRFVNDSQYVIHESYKSLDCLILTK
jgi:hypothetical protein